MSPWAWLGLAGAAEVVWSQSIRPTEGFTRLGPTQIRMQRAPAWTSDWITAAGKAKLRDYGIVPPAPVDLARGVPLRFVPRAVTALACPRCDSRQTERLAAFGATACKALWRCRACGEPFEHFKAI